jgi:hypothetical protein
MASKAGLLFAGIVVLCREEGVAPEHWNTETRNIFLAWL